MSDTQSQIRNLTRCSKDGCSSRAAKTHCRFAAKIPGSEREADPNSRIHFAKPWG